MDCLEWLNRFALSSTGRHNARPVIRPIIRLDREVLPPTQGWRGKMISEGLAFLIEQGHSPEKVLSMNKDELIKLFDDILAKLTF